MTRKKNIKHSKYTNRLFKLNKKMNKISDTDITLTTAVKAGKNSSIYENNTEYYDYFQ